MLRAIALIALVSIGLAFSHGVARAAAQRVNLINGIGLIDYSHKQHFKVGSWVKYHVTGSSELGESDDYTVTILIAGEEKFWGEDGFWVETWTEPKVGPPNSIATLMSYAIFDDSLAVTNMQLYSRKLITEIDPNTGNPIQVVSKRNSGSIKGRKSGKEPVVVHIDTLGKETTKVPRGEFEALKISMRQGIGSTADVGDSSVRTEVTESRMVYMSRQVPITAIVREDIDNLIKRKSWKVGQSTDAPLHMMEHAHGTAEVIEWGDGLTPQLVPEGFRRSLRDYLPAANKPAPAKRATATRKKTS
jgi:hypothetical protein